MRVRTKARGVFCPAVLAWLAVALAAAAQPAWGDGASEKNLLAKRHGGRLPPYYRHVVTPDQRDKIYKIQEEYRPKIEALETQLKALKRERDEKIAAILTPEQKKQVEQAAKKAKDKPATPAETAPPSPPAGETSPK